MAAPLAVRAAAWHLPETRTRIKDLPELATLPPGERESLLGLGVQTVCVDDARDDTGLALAASRTALDEAGLGPDDVDALIVVEPRAPGRLVASETTRLQERLGVRRALTFGVGGLGCVSVAPALFAARGLLAADEDMRNVLVAHGSRPATPVRYRHPVTVNGDSGQALVLSRTGPVTVVDMVQESNGAYWDLFHVVYRDRPDDQWREECEDPAAYSFRLAVESRNRLRDLLGRLLERNGLGREDVAGFVGQNLSVGGFAFVEEALGIELLPACRENLRQYGHLGPNDILLNLYSAMARGEIADGDLVVLINVSPVAAWSLMVVRAGEEDGADYL
ncbi:3-oxoacyl-[acyl-carrier-protein] synthase III C-terminal domain-containing protein [Streptomyces noursei]|uniref:3-oxoacyl-[acyl-carrier-protein] synthase III C-terminal domain-containing protein n=1 Tax=Streptomyces noursei TaxID=1971 RepID=UPI00380D5139